MSWIGLTDRRRGLFNPAGLGAGREELDETILVAQAILPKGTIAIETRFMAEPGSPQTLLRYQRSKDWMRELGLVLRASGALQFLLRQGGAVSQAELKFPAPAHGSEMRIHYSWNGPERWGRLAVQMLETGEIHVAELADPIPLPMLDALTMMRKGQATRIDRDAAYVAISDEVEPLGLDAGVCDGTPVETPSGAVRVEDLRVGDRVVTATSGARPIRWITKRTVPALGAWRPVRIRAPFFGLGEDLLVAPDHRLRVEDAEAEYLTGQEEVLLPADRLIGSHAALSESRIKTVTYYHVLLDRHDLLLHGSVWSESLFVGQIAMDARRLAATALGEMPFGSVPRHTAFARHRLSDTEARSLASVLHR